MRRKHSATKTACLGLSFGLIAIGVFVAFFSAAAIGGVLAAIGVIGVYAFGRRRHDRRSRADRRKLHIPCEFERRLQERRQLA